MGRFANVYYREYESYQKQQHFTDTTKAHRYDYEVFYIKLFLFADRMMVTTTAYKLMFHSDPLLP